MHSLGERVASVAEAFGISFAIFKGIEFVHEGVEEMEKLHKSEAALQNTMENMGTYTQEAFEKMVAGAHDLAQGINYTQADVMGLQSQLGLVGNIGEEEMGRITKASADLATKMGTGLEEAGNLIAKAINAPEMARRLGMALKIDPRVMEHIQSLAKHGHEAQARLELLAITEAKVGGAADAAFNADPMSRFNKTMLEVKQEVGGLAIDLLKILTPALEWVASTIKSTIVVAKEIYHWFGENKKLIRDIGIVVGLTATAWGLYSLWSKRAVIWSAIKTAYFTVEMGVLTALGTAVEFLNAMFIASPIGWIVVGIAAITAAVIYCYEHFAKFRAVLWGVWETIKEFGRLVGEVFMGVGKVIVGVLTLRPSMITEGFNETLDAISNAGNRLGHAFKTGYDDGMADFAAGQAKESLIPKKGVGKPQQFESDKIKDPKTKATGSKSITINVSIQKLGETHISVTNIKEGMQSLREGIIKTLSGAVNDFQIVADH